MDLLTVEAIYQNGMIKPLTALHLRENERIRLRIERRHASAQEEARNIINLRGIWKDRLTAAEREEDWVSTTVATIRRESAHRVEQLAREIDEALFNA
ncbi:MAG: hypothetical protein DRI79_04675 [Chloroflexi bacterium]|nr:MAG: hypothetical protein DRI80_08995 [Chloroflexota bacterium]RLC90661.1 MAG: hypothetical protein DRI79_04675 [Chloroflexota bacterium]HEY66639.1 DUF104 domain-containing protein [Thermoflexia bacterium]